MIFFYEYTLYNILKRYPDYHIEQGEYVESIKYFNKLCECCSTHFNKRLDKTDHTWIESVYNVIGTNSFAKSTNEYKKGKLFEILIILYITEGHKAINSFPDFIEKWFRDGILILITDQGDDVIEEMKNKFFDKKSEFSYIYIRLNSVGLSLRLKERLVKLISYLLDAIIEMKEEDN